MGRDNLRQGLKTTTVHAVCKPVKRSVVTVLYVTPKWPFDPQLGRASPAATCISMSLSTNIKPVSPTPTDDYHPTTEPSPRRPILLDSLLQFEPHWQVRWTIEWAFARTRLLYQYLCTADPVRGTRRAFAQQFPSARRRPDETIFHGFIIDGFLSLLDCSPTASGTSRISKEGFTPLLSQMDQLVHPMGHQPLITMNFIQR